MPRGVRISVTELPSLSRAALSDTGVDEEVHPCVASRRNPSRRRQQPPQRVPERGVHRIYAGSEGNPILTGRAASNPRHFSAVPKKCERGGCGGLAHSVHDADRQRRAPHHLPFESTRRRTREDRRDRAHRDGDRYEKSNRGHSHHTRLARPATQHRALTDLLRHLAPMKQRRGRDVGPASRCLWTELGNPGRPVPERCPRAAARADRPREVLLEGAGLARCTPRRSRSSRRRSPRRRSRPSGSEEDRHERLVAREAVCGPETRRRDVDRPDRAVGVDRDIARAREVVLAENA